MRILFSIGSFGRGGKEGRMIALMQHLVERGHEVGLIASAASSNLSRVGPLCRRVYRYEAGRPLFNLREHRRAVNDFHPDLVHCWNGSCTTFAILARLGRKARVVTSEITNARPLKGLSLECLVTRFNFAFSRIVFSNSHAGLAAKKAPKQKARVIYNGFRLDRLEGTGTGRNGSSEKSGPLNVVMAARFCREKDYETVLRAAAIAQEKKAGICFSLAGEGPDLQRMRNLARERGLENVRFLGHVEEIDRFLAGMDVGLLATDPRFHQEGISNSVMEYMAHGMPAVVTDGPAVPEIVSDGCNGFIVTPRDPERIVEKLIALNSHRELLQKLGRNAKKTVLEKFNLEAMGDGFVRAYQSLSQPEILVCVPDLASPGGVASYHRSLEAHFSSRVRYFRRSPREGRSGFPACCEMAARYLFFWRQVQGERLRLVQVNTSLGAAGVRRDLLLLKMARRAGKKTVWFLRGWDESYARKIDADSAHPVRAALRQVDALVVLGRSFAERIRSWGFEGPLFLETTAVESRLLEREDGRDPDPVIRRILFLARVERTKGIFQLIDAYCQLAEKSPRPVELVIAGDGSAKGEAKEYVRRNSLCGIRFLGYVSGESKEMAYRSAELYVFPSTHGEGMPNSVLEAMAAGLPVITTPAGGVHDFFEEGKMGRLISAPEPGALAQVIQQLLERPELRERIGQYNAAFAGRHFAASRVVNRLERIWDQVLSGAAEEAETYSWKVDEERPALAAKGKRPRRRSRRNRQPAPLKGW